MRGMLVRLRAVEEDDYRLFPEWVGYSLAGVLSSGGQSNDLSAADWQRVITTGDTRYAVIELLSGGAIGAVSWRAKRYPGSFEVGGLVGRQSLWDSGSGVEAAMLMIDHLFQALNANRVEMMAAIYNRRTVGFLIKGGLTVEAVLRDYFFADGEYHDAVVCSILRAEYYSASYDEYMPSTEVLPPADRAAARALLSQHLAENAAGNRTL